MERLLLLVYLLLYISAILLGGGLLLSLDLLLLEDLLPDGDLDLYLLSGLLKYPLDGERENLDLDLLRECLDLFRLVGELEYLLFLGGVRESLLLGDLEYFLMGDLENFLLGD